MKEIAVTAQKLTPATIFGDDWMLLTTGSKENGVNTMTIALGHLGALWERGSHQHRLPTAVCYVRPSRYTKEFLDREEFFTLSWFGNEQKKALGYLGSHSGRDGDKIAEAGLTTAFEEGIPYFAEAKRVYLCRKLYHAPLLREGFVDQSLIDFHYPQGDFHEMYIGEIVKILERE